MDNIARTYIDHVEQDLLEAKSLLQSGLETALERISLAAENATAAMSDQAIAKLRAIEDLSEESIDSIEKHLGNLNYMAANGDIKNSDDFDLLAQPLSEALHDARTTLAKLDEIGMRELGSVAGPISHAWRNLHIAMDFARLELALAEKDSVKEADDLRQELDKRFEEALIVAKAKDAETLGHKLHEIALHLGSIIGVSLKTFFGLARENPEWKTSE